MRKEDSAVKIILEDLIARYKEDIIAIYGIGSYFDEGIPRSWKNNDIDIIAIVKSLKRFPKVDWTEVKFLKRKIEGKEIWVGFNSLEGYQDKDLFRSQSFSNYEWSILDIKYPQNSLLLYGKDIRDYLPDIKSLVFDFDDILARGLYHLDKSLGEKNQDIAKKEFSKAVFKTGFYVCVYFNKSFTDTRVLQIGQKLKETSEIVRKIEDINGYFEEAIIFRTTGHYITKFEKLQEQFVKFIFKLLKLGGLHKKMSTSELKNYLTSWFSGFPHLLHFLNKINNVSQKTSIKGIKGNLDLQSVNLIGIVKEIGKIHSFERADGSKGSFISFIIEDQSGAVRVVIWNDEIRKRLFENTNLMKNSTVEIINGYIRLGYKNKVEVHIGKYGNVVIHKIFSPTERIKRDVSKTKVITQLKALNINETKVTKTPCHFCGLLCSPSAKKCPKCGEPLNLEF